MKKFRLFWSIVKRCRAEKITLGFFISFFIVSLIIMIREPDICTYGQAMWYTFVSCTTIGFGDITVSTALSMFLTVYMTLYEIIWIAILSGVIVSHYMEVITRREKMTATKFLDKLEHLPELDKKELQELSNKVREFRKNS